MNLKAFIPAILYKDSSQQGGDRKADKEKKSADPKGSAGPSAEEAARAAEAELLGDDFEAELAISLEEAMATEVAPPSLEGKLCLAWSELSHMSLYSFPSHRRHRGERFAERVRQDAPGRLPEQAANQREQGDDRQRRGRLLHEPEHQDQQEEAYKVGDCSTGW